MNLPLKPIFRATTPIRYTTSHGHATGFFYRSRVELYLITCRHAIYSPSNSEVPFLSQSEGEEFVPERIHIKLRQEDDVTETTTKTLELYEDGTPKWIEPDYYPADIVGIPLDFSIQDTGNTAFGTTNLSVVHRASGGYGDVKPGESAIVAGYPVLSTPSDTPVLRDAMISSPMGLDLSTQPYFLIDAKLHDGTSGSPVLIRTENSRGTSVLSLVGVHAGRYNLMEDGSENLNRVWFFEHIGERFKDIAVEVTGW